MSITIGKHGSVTFDSEAVSLYRLMTLVQGLKLETKGMKLTRGVSCYAIAKKEFGLKGNKQSVLLQMEGILAEAKKQHEVIRC